MALCGLTLSGCPDPGDAPSGGTVGSDCASTGVQATSGGDHGVPFALPDDGALDETGEELLDVGVIPEADDPTEWQFDSVSGVYYRSPTKAEMQAYRWTRFHLLVLPNQTTFLNPVLAGGTGATVALPVHDNAQNRPQRGLDIATVALARQYSHNAIPYAEKRISSAGKYTQWVGFPTLNLYLPTAITWQTVPDRMIAVMSSSRGGLELHGGTRTEQMWMRGPYLDGKHVILDIAPPVGTAFYLHHTRHEQTFQALTLGNMGPEGIAQLSRGHNDRDLSPPSTPLADLTPIGQCVDGLDNDPDAFADSCDYNCVQHNDFGGDNWDYDAQFEYSKDFALLGDVEFCSPSDAMGVPDPFATMALFGEEAIRILNGVLPPPPYVPVPRAPPFRMTVALCSFVWDDADQAQVDACHMSASACPPSLGNYPLGGTGFSTTNLYEKAWEYLDANIDIQPAAERRPVHIAAIITGRPIGANGSTEGWTDNYATNGALVIQDESTNSGGVGGTLAHEIGHTFGLAHDTATWPSSTAGGFMNSGNSQTPILNWNADSEICNANGVCLTQGEVWRDLVPSKFQPRASGFAWVGCDNDADCDTGHPDLECRADQGEVCRPKP